MINENLSRILLPYNENLMDNRDQNRYNLVQKNKPNQTNKQTKNFKKM